MKIINMTQCQSVSGGNTLQFFSNYVELTLDYTDRFTYTDGENSFTLTSLGLMYYSFGLCNTFKGDHGEFLYASCGNVHFTEQEISYGTKFKIYNF